jgi:ribosomal protein L29
MKRYEPDQYFAPFGEYIPMLPEENGGWITYKDHVAERAKDKGYTENLEGARKEDQEYINQLVKERGEWTVEVLVKEKEIKGLKEEIARLNTEIEKMKNGHWPAIYIDQICKQKDKEIARLRKALGEIRDYENKGDMMGILIAPKHIAREALEGE